MDKHLAHAVVPSLTVGAQQSADDPTISDPYVLSRTLRRDGAASFSLAAKRMLDVVVAVVLLLLALPLLVGIALAVRIESRGPVLYRAQRVGRYGRILLVPKFRKMRETAPGPPLTVAGDARFTRIGGFLSRTRLDELPQLWLVLLGHMSLVGPRPEAPHFVALHSAEYAEILRVRPGITGWTQLAYANEGQLLERDDPVGHYVREMLPDKVRLDRLYATCGSLHVDLKLLFWTPLALTLPLHVRFDADRRALVVSRASGAHRQTCETAADPSPDVYPEDA